jgi:hypothetical protein
MQYAPDNEGYNHAKQSFLKNCLTEKPSEQSPEQQSKTSTEIQPTKFTKYIYEFASPMDNGLNK